MYINHWKIQRLSAIALIPAMLYLIYYFTNISNLSYNDVITDLSSLTGIIYVTVMSLILFTHSSLGIETILEDYVHDSTYQKFFISLSKIIHVILLLLTLSSLYLIVGT